MNNLVQNVLAASRLIDRRAADPVQVRRFSRQLAEAAERGGRLARRMLDFSRSAPDRAEQFDLRLVLGGLDDLLAGLLGPEMRLDVALPPILPPAAADRREFETVLVNLIVNARDAMPAGGTIRVAVMLDPPPGDARPAMLRITVMDSGIGMPAELLARAGEPFFTTKPPGRGTGLGLTMARQFAERSGGTLRIESQQGRGTTVTLWLRAAGSRRAATVPA
jgi:signal transduction histidine kinase